MEKTLKPSCIYVRRSLSSSTKQQNSLKVGEAICRQWADRNGYEVGETYRESMSGRKADRPGLEAALAWADLNDGVVIIEKADRLGRTMDLIGKLEAHLPRIRIASMGEDKSPDFLMLSMQLLISTMESRANSQRVAAVHAYLRSQDTDEARASLASWGRGSKDVAWKHSEETRTYNASTFNSRIQGICDDLHKAGYLTLNEKAAKLNERGHKTRRGSNFTKQTLYRILKY